MTREERENAIDIIQSILDKYEEDECLAAEITIGDEDIEALKMAIKALEQEPTTKNDLGVDVVSRKDVHDMLENLPVTVEDKWFNWLQKACMRLAELPSVTPQEPQTFRWCTDCREYDQEKHCCHRWSKVIRDTVEEMKQEPILDKIKAEIESYKLSEDELSDMDEDSIKWGMKIVCDIVDKYRSESEE